MPSLIALLIFVVSLINSYWFSNFVVDIQNWFWIILVDLCCMLESTDVYCSWFSLEMFVFFRTLARSYSSVISGYFTTCTCTITFWTLFIILILHFTITSESFNLHANNYAFTFVIIYPHIFQVNVSPYHKSCQRTQALLPDAQCFWRMLLYLIDELSLSNVQK